MSLPIGGFQKLSLVDFPETICSIVFTQGCIFRCAYCHNPDLIGFAPSKIDEQGVFDYLVQNKKILEGVCITGGEPTIHLGLHPFIEKIKELGFKVKLDTNGIRPAVVARLLEHNLLDYIAMDIKSPWEKYETIVRSFKNDSLTVCQETLLLIQDSGVNHEFRTTVMPGVHTSDDFLSMAGYLRDGERYYIQETQYKKTLDQIMYQDLSFSVPDVITRIQEKFPNLIVAHR